MALEFTEQHPVFQEHLSELTPVFEDILRNYRDRGYWSDPSRPYIFVDGHTGPAGHEVESIWFTVPQDIFPEGAMDVSFGVGVFAASVSVDDVRLQESDSGIGQSPDVIFAVRSGRLETGRLHYFPSRRSFIFEFRTTPIALRTTPTSMSIRDLQGKLLAVGIIDYGRDEATSLSLAGMQFKLPSGVAMTLGREAFATTLKAWPEVSYFTIVDDARLGHWPVEPVLP